MYNITYMGYSDDVMDCLLASKCFKLCKVVGVKGRMSQRQYELMKEYHLPYMELKCANDINQIQAFIENEYIIMHKFEFIIPPQFIENHEVFNFHGGNLRSNRGAHPIVRSILNFDKETCLSLYKLTGGIDEGLLLGEYFVNITEHDTGVTLNRKMMEGIPQLLARLNEYLEGRISGEIITNGKYYSKVTEEDYTVNIYEDSMKVICAKIRSQAGYRGGLFIKDNQRYRIKNYEQKKNSTPSYSRWCEDRKLVINDNMDRLECYYEQE